MDCWINRAVHIPAPCASTARSVQTEQIDDAADFPWDVASCPDAPVPWVTIPGTPPGLGQ